MSEEEWLNNHKEEIKNINNMVDDLEKDKKVQKVVETFSRWQDPTIEKLQIEKLQLERQVDMAHHVLSATRKERDKYKEVIEEVRKLIEEHQKDIDKAKEFYSDLEDDSEIKTTCFQIWNNQMVRNYDVLQILDKVKENEKNHC